MNRGFHIGRLFGININADWSWLVVFALGAVLSPLPAFLFTFTVCPASAILGIWLIFVPGRKNDGSRK